METATRFRIYLASQKFLIIVGRKALFIYYLKSPTSPRLQRWAMFISKFSYVIVYKKGRFHTNADELSRRTYEPVKTPNPTITNNLTDDNFGIAIELSMSERDFNSWMVQLANENWEDYRFGKELQIIPWLLRWKLKPPLILRRSALCSHSEELKDIEPQSQRSVDPRIRRSTDQTRRLVQSANSCHSNYRVGAYQQFE